MLSSERVASEVLVQAPVPVLATCSLAGLAAMKACAKHYMDVLLHFQITDDADTSPSPITVRPTAFLV